MTIKQINKALTCDGHLGFRAPDKRGIMDS